MIMNGQRKGGFTAAPGRARLALVLALLVPASCRIHVDQLQETERDRGTVAHVPEDLKRGFTHPRAAVVTPSNPGDGLRAYDEGLASDLGGVLGRVGGLVVVEKREIETVLKTIEQNLSDLVDASKLNEVPGLEAISHLVVAHVTHADSSEEEIQIAPPAKPGDRPVMMKVINAAAGISIRVIEVGTGVVLRDIRKQGATSSYLSALSGSTHASLIADAIREAASAALPELQNLFPVRGYVIRLRGDALVALISLGQRDDIDDGRRFRVFQRTRYTDALGVAREETTNIGELKAIQVLDDTTWCKVLEGREKILNGMEVESLPEGVGIFEALFGGW